jgi:Polyketide cyclase / dehydrase and lipid transport
MTASSDAVWRVLADFPNLADHWSGLRASRAIGDRTRGLGARRHVELRPIGGLDETIIAWEDGRKIVTQNQPSAIVPFKQAEATLTLERKTDGALVTFDYRYVPRGGPLGRVTGPLIDRMLTANFNGMLAAIEQAAVADD